MDTYNGFSVEKQLSKAFESVQNKAHWKGPIDAVVTANTLALVCTAIVFYTATLPTVTPLPEAFDGSAHFRVQAAGYRAGPAA